MFFESFFREKYEFNTASDDDEDGQADHKKDEELAKEIQKQLKLRRKISKLSRDSDDERAEEEINAKTSFIRAASSTRLKVRGLTLKVIFPI